MRQSVFLLLVCLLATSAQAACRVEPRTTVRADLLDGHVMLTVQVDDVPQTFILDTGAQRTLMGEEAVRRLGIARDSWVASTVRGLGGLEERPNALPRSLRLGGVELRRRTLLGDNSVTVGPLPLNRVGDRQIAGLLGRDFVAAFDLDLDLPHGRLSLYDVRDCALPFVPWTAPYAALPLTTPMDAALVAEVLLDGRQLRALIDSGASASLVTASGTVRLGLTPALLARDPGGIGGGIGPAAVPMRLHRFAELRVGPEVARQPSLWVASVHVVPTVDMLLGVDWLRTRRVWLSFATRQMFIARPGG